QLGVLPELRLGGLALAGLQVDHDDPPLVIELDPVHRTAQKRTADLDLEVLLRAQEAAARPREVREVARDARHEHARVPPALLSQPFGLEPELAPPALDRLPQLAGIRDVA